MDTTNDDNINSSSSEDDNNTPNRNHNNADNNHSSRSANNNNNEHETTMAKRRAIQQILSQSSLTERQRALQIQQIMNGSNPRTIISQLQQEQQNHSLQQQQQQQCKTSTTVETICSDMVNCLAQGISSGGASVVSSFVGAGTGVLPCVHYERKCFIVAPCCGNVYGCRVCHDELTQEEHGPMDRTKVTEIICKECHTRQPCSNQCVNPSCGVKAFAEYYCDKCNLWMGLEKKPFHCSECGICRVGGREQYRHCDVCSMCIHVDTYEKHICLKDKYKNQCPVCREDMHTSRHAPQDLPCGHAIHAHCFRKLAGFDYRCPVCKKTVVSQSSMAAAWAERAMDIQRQPMPNDLAKKVNIMCYDCEEKSRNLSWHFLGVQCPHCMSFNTVVEEVVDH